MAARLPSGLAAREGLAKGKEARSANERHGFCFRGDATVSTHRLQCRRSTVNWFRKRKPAPSSQARKNIESVAQIEREFLRDRTLAERVSDTITRFVGSMAFVV